MSVSEDINVQIIDMDVMIPEQITKNSDGSYTIFLNARHTQENRIAAYQHAIEHIERGDFDTDYGDVQEVESEAHGLIAKKEETQNIVALTPPPPRKRKRRKNRKHERYVHERAAFLMEHYDMFAMAEHNYLYGKDL